MTDSVIRPHELLTMKSQRLCDYCSDNIALLYCKADSAKLCISCDREVHSSNQLFSKHTRSLLCDACHSSPSSIFCETQQSVFCHNCDWERHKFSLSSSVHNRRPIEGFRGCPSVSELVSIFGFEDLGDKKALVLNDEEGNGFVQPGLNTSSVGDGYSDLFIWRSPAIVNLDNLIVSSNSGENFQTLGVPPLPKNHNAVCGQHKEEVVHQLRELARLEPDANFKYQDNEPVDVFRTSAAAQNRWPRGIYTGCETNENIFQWFSDSGEAGNQVSHVCSLPKNNLEESPLVPDKILEVEPQCPVSTAAISFFPKVGSHEINSQERDSAISRYKEKKKSRRYNKHIRYESRKVRAESRTRIKGRFAKMDR